MGIDTIFLVWGASQRYHAVALEIGGKRLNVLKPAARA